MHGHANWQETQQLFIPIRAKIHNPNLCDPPDENIASDVFLFPHDPKLCPVSLNLLVIILIIFLFLFLENQISEKKHLHIFPGVKNVTP